MDAPGGRLLEGGRVSPPVYSWFQPPAQAWRRADSSCSDRSLGGDGTERRAADVQGWNQREIGHKTEVNEGASLVLPTKEMSSARNVWRVDPKLLAGGREEIAHTESSCGERGVGAPPPSGPEGRMTMSSSTALPGWGHSHFHWKEGMQHPGNIWISVENGRDGAVKDRHQWTSTEIPT